MDIQRLDPSGHVPGPIHNGNGHLPVNNHNHQVHKLGEPSVIKVTKIRGDFVASKHFIANYPFDGGKKVAIKINSCSSKFKDHFLDGPGKIEKGVGKGLLKSHPITPSGIFFSQALAIIGNSYEDQVCNQVYLAWIHKLVMAQGVLKQDGPLMMNGWPNCFLVLDREKRSRWFIAAWYYDGWNFNSLCTSDRSYIGGGRVFTAITDSNQRMSKETHNPTNLI